MKHGLFLLLIILGLASCKPKQNMVYMSTGNSSEEIAQAKYEGNRIQDSDVLLIMVSALDELAVRPFNLSTMTATNTEGGGGRSGVCALLRHPGKGSGTHHRV